MQKYNYMKVMWLCNTPTINVAETYNLPQPAQGGWLVSVSEALEKNETIEFLFVNTIRNIFLYFY